jgi:hypothetical protein
MADLILSSGNLHNEEAAARYVVDDDVDIAMVSEAQKNGPRPILRNAPGYRYRTGPPNMGTNDAARETGILMRSSLPNRGGGSYFVSKVFLPAPRTGKERWAQVALTRVEGVDIAAISGHPVAAPNALKRGVENGPLASRHRDFTDWLDDTLAYHLGRGGEAAVGLDANVRRGWAGADEMEALIARHNLRGIWDGLDLLMVSRGLHIELREVDRKFPSNHPLLRLGVSVRRNRRK